MATKNKPTKKELDHILEPFHNLAVRIKDLNPDPANARAHNERNLNTIMTSLKRYKQRMPIVVQKDGMIVRAGNGRLEAAKLLGWEWIAAVVVDEENIDAVSFAIADNRTAELAEWDNSTLAALLEELPDDVLGADFFTSKEMENLLDVGGLPEDENEDNGTDTEPSPTTFVVVIEFDSESKQMKAHEELTKKGYNCQPV